MSEKKDPRAAEHTPECETGPADKGSKAGEQKIDLEALDLTVEEVEERIHPSETNVFDK